MSETRFSFTKALLDAIPLPEAGQRATYHDKKAGGLQLRVTSTGVKTFCVFRRAKTGKPERVTLGKYPFMTIEQARDKTAEVNADFAKGESPSAKKRRAKLEAKPLKEVFTDYLAAHSDLKALTVKDMKRAMTEMFSDWQDWPITRITGDMCDERHRNFGEERSRARANLGMRYLRAVLNFAQVKYRDENSTPLLRENPVKKLSELRRWYKVKRRRTVIEPHELGGWVNAVLALPNQDMGDYFLTVLLTGLRKEEALKLAWADVDLTGRTLTVRDPKNHNDHTLPLSPYLLELFTRRKSTAVSDLVFGRISNFRYAQAAIEKACGVKFCIHDLRRTFATIAESLDIPAYALKRLLNHATEGDVTAGYIVASTERLRRPMEQITDYVLKAAGIKESAQVLEFKPEAKGHA